MLPDISKRVSGLVEAMSVLLLFLLAVVLLLVVVTVVADGLFAVIMVDD